METIYAQATPAGRGGVSVVRVSGPRAREVVGALTGRDLSPRKASLCALRDRGELIDKALVLTFEAGRSFTGEESAEFHLHGAPVIVARLGQALDALGVRLAEAGEFTRRAFENGKIDLTETEGLADLLAAETEAQRKLAMRAADGALSATVEGWRADLIRAGALIEVTLDFADEEVPEDIPGEVFVLIDKVRDSLTDMVKGYPAAERLRQGFEVAFIGEPNSGKSTLLNRIARREVSIVSDIAGTTRDVIEFRADLKGLAVTFLDTAGLRESEDIIETIGIDRAKSRAMSADLRIHVGGVQEDLWQPGDIEVISKSDLGHGTVSGLNGDGVSDLLDRIYDELSQRIAHAGPVSHARQAAALKRAIAALEEKTEQPEILAEHIRRAAHALQEMVGKVNADDYLDVIFSSFCIGK